jgi:hypothetical protein
MTRLNLTLAFLCVAAMSLSCQSPNPAEPSRTPTEDRGISLTSGAWSSWTELVWSKSGHEIYYNTLSPGSIRAVSVSDKSTRLLDAGASDWPNSLTLSSDGNHLYYLIPWPGIFTSKLFRINLTTQVSEAVISDVFRYIVSPDNNHIAYVSSDSSLCVLDLVTMLERRMAVGEPLVFSPDGKEILFRRRTYPNPDSYNILSWENGATRSISIGLSAEELPGTEPIKLFRWDSRGTRIFYVGPSGYNFNVRNLTIGTTVRIWNVASPESPDPLHYGWSPDGNTIALWTSRCLKPKDLFNCDVLQHTLHTIDIDAQRERRIAWGNLSPSEGYGRWMAFSPDSRRIAYVLGSDIYMKDIQ